MKKPLKSKRHRLAIPPQKEHDEPELKRINRELEKEIKMRKRAEEGARKAYTELDQVFNAAVALCVIDKHQKIIRVNDQFSKLFREEKEKIIGQKCCDLLKIPRCDSHGCPLSRALRNDSLQEFEFKKEVQGRQAWFSATPSPYRNEQGELIGIVVALIDISERKEAEEQARLNREQLIQADKMTSLGILVSGVAHEIGNPNAFITLNAPIFKRVWDNLVPILEAYHRQHGELYIGSLSFAEIRRMVPELLDGMIEGARRINRIVKNLKDFARKEPADLDEEVNINEVIESALTLLHNMIDKSTETFSVRYGENIPRFKGSCQQIEQVVVNIVINACQALENRSQAIFVSTAYDARCQQVVLKIRDEGRGMAKEIQKQIFDPFFTSKQSAGGTGLGLSISANIIRAHNGTIRVDSTPGRGTTFTITLPTTKE